MVSENQLKNLYMKNLETGETTKLSDERGFATIPTIETAKEIDADFIHLPEKEISISGKITNLSDGLAQLLMGKRLVFTGTLDQIMKNFTETVTLDMNILAVRLKQNKTHKKYRINKKWIKRYGYTLTVHYNIDDAAKWMYESEVIE